MKKHFLLIVALAAAMLAQAEVIANETFSGFPTDWANSGTLTTGTGRTQDAALTYSNGGGTFVLSGLHNSVKIQIENCASYVHSKALEATLNANTFYMAFMIRPNGSVGATNAAVFGLGTGATSPALRVWLGKDDESGKCKIGITRSSGTGTDVEWATNTITENETHLVVVRYVKQANDTTAALFVDPIIAGAEPETPACADNKVISTKNSSRIPAKKSFSHMIFYSNGSNKTNASVGGVRIATTWAEVVENQVNEEAVESVETDFKNDNWGKIMQKTNNAYPAGPYADTIINGFAFHDAAMADGSIKREGETTTAYTNRVLVRKSGYLTTPLLKSVSTVTLAYSLGNDDQNITLQYLNEDKEWVNAKTVPCMKTLTEATYDLGINYETKIRVQNSSTSTLYIWALSTKPFLTLNADGYTTFSWDKNYTVEGATAYSARWEEGVSTFVTMDEIEGVIPANEGIILAGNPYATVTVTATADEATSITENALAGTVNTPVAALGKYLLARQNEQTAFYLYTDGDYMIPVRKAYLTATSENAPARVGISFMPNTATAIEAQSEIKATKVMSNGVLYIMKGNTLHTITGARVK